MAYLFLVHLLGDRPQRRQVAPLISLGLLLFVFPCQAEAIDQLLRLHAIPPQLEHLVEELELEALCIHAGQSGGRKLAVGARAQHIDVPRAVQC
jgi:hypothetical protein